MRHKCYNASCDQQVEPNRTNRAFNGCCSAACRDVVARGYGKHGFTAYASATPGAPVFGASVNRRHGADRKAQTE
jgi:hypothetical protein